MYQKTWSCCNETLSDSITFSDSVDYNPSWFSTVNVFRGGKKIFTYHDSTLNLVADGNLFEEHLFNRNKESFLIFTCVGTPGWNYFLVLQKSVTGYQNIGFTPSSSAEIFGDIDFDGIFEIGGIGNLAESGGSDKEIIANTKQGYRVFEVRKGFPIDSILTKVLMPLVIKNRLKESKM